MKHFINLSSEILSIPSKLSHFLFPPKTLQKIIQDNDLKAFTSHIAKFRSEELYVFLQQSYKKYTFSSKVEILFDYFCDERKSFLPIIFVQLNTDQKIQLTTWERIKKYDDAISVFLKNIDQESLVAFIASLSKEFSYGNLVKELVLGFNHEKIALPFFANFPTDALFEQCAAFNNFEENNLLHVFSTSSKNNKKLKLLSACVTYFSLEHKNKIVSHVNLFGQTPLHTAANLGEIEIFLMYFDLIEDHNLQMHLLMQQDAYGMTPLHYFARLGFIPKSPSLFDKLTTLRNVLPSDQALHAEFVHALHFMESPFIANHNIANPSEESVIQQLTSQLNKEIANLKINSNEFKAARLIQRKIRHNAQQELTEQIQDILYVYLQNKNISCNHLVFLMTHLEFYYKHRHTSEAENNNLYPNRYYEIYDNILDATDFSMFSQEQQIDLAIAFIKGKRENREAIFKKFALEENSILLIAQEVIPAYLSLEKFYEYLSCTPLLKKPLVSIMTKNVDNLIGSMDMLDKSLAQFVIDNDRLAMWKFTYQLFSRFTDQYCWDASKGSVIYAIMNKDFALQDISVLIKIAFHDIRQWTIEGYYFSQQLPSAIPYQSRPKSWGDDPEKIVPIKHGGGLFFLMDFLTGREKGYKLERIGHGIQVAPVHLDRESFYAARGIYRSMDIPVLLEGSIAAKYLDSAPNGYEAGLRPCFLPYLENCTLQPLNIEYKGNRPCGADDHIAKYCKNT